MSMLRRMSTTKKTPKVTKQTTMEHLMGLLRIHVRRGINLAIRDVFSSDPYVIVRMGTQKLKTRIIDTDVNPVWDETLTLSVADLNTPIKLAVYDYDTFKSDDEMGDAEFDIHSLVKALRMDLAGYPDGSILARIQPNENNCLSDESKVILKDGKIFQDLRLRLRNVESGEVELQLEWVDVPGSRGVDG